MKEQKEDYSLDFFLKLGIKLKITQRQFQESKYYQLLCRTQAPENNQSDMTD